MKLSLHILLSLALCKDWVLSLGPSSRIIGGMKVTENYPFMVPVQAKSSYGYNSEVAHDGWAHYCGGSILSTRHVLTAAHCVSVLIKDFSIFAGTHQLDGMGTRYNVDSVLVHPDFVNVKKNDLAIMKTTQTIVYVPNKIEKITLFKDFIGDDVLCTVMRWGYVNQDRYGASNDLLEINVPTISNEACRRTDGFAMKVQDILTEKLMNEVKHNLGMNE